MAEYLTRDQVINSLLNTPIPFLDSIACPRGYVYHPSGSGIFVLRGIVNNPTARFARYEVRFTGNIAIPTGGTVTPIATAIMVNGEAKEGSRSIFTPSAVGIYGAVDSNAIITVPAGCCLTMSVEYVNGFVEDPAGVPTPSINIVDGSVDIVRIA